MSLSNALFTGLSGLDANQTRLNVIGNNIANSNTVAYKSTRSLFKPQFYVTDTGGSQPTADSGGTNPSQRGLGVVVATLEKDFGQGSIETTGRPTDLAVDGDGFFVVRSDEQKYTRDGSFKLNPNNQLVTSAGDYVQGYSVDANFNIIPGRLGNLTIPLGSATTAEATTRATLEGNLNAGGAVASGGSILVTQSFTTAGNVAPTGATPLTALIAPDATTPFAVGDVFTYSGTKGGRSLPAETFTVTAASTVDDLGAFFTAASGINTTLPDDGNPATATPGVTLEADPLDATRGRLVFAGNLGTANQLTLASADFRTATGKTPFTFTAGTNAAGVANNPVGESVRTSMIAYDSLGTPLQVDVTAVLESTSTAGNTWRFFAESGGDTDLDLVVGTGTMTFDADGRLITAAGTDLTVNRTDTGAGTPLSFQLDFSGMTSLTSTRSEMVMTNQDGSPFGSLASFSIGNDGRIMGSFTNGVNRTLGQLAMANFANVQGLVDRGGNMYVEGANSGAVVIGVPGTLGTGKIVGGALELSNVDLSEEFVNLIVASTGFTAASRVISSSDQLITELLNTTR